ncbi:FAD-dependent oxidoreductase [Nocardia sp. CNY236]|uniref:flavin monoamine oxidase family protein n=1 Tax=Nocardia sp. CNY236 TaxID=1169152 RepID=UPI0004920CA4|nr:FAD-dependent oxidoreductase [Nocardia sp. CNY236]
MSESRDVIVVGAGVAGLTAARALAAAGRDVLVLEARERVGGRTLNVEVPGSDAYVEVGGMWVGPGQDRVLALLNEHGLTTYPTFDQGSRIGEFDGRIVRYQGRMPRLNPLVLADLALTQLRLDRSARRIPLDAPWTAPHASALDGQTFDTWLRNHSHTSTGREFFRLVTQAIWCAEPAEISALWAQFYIHSGGGIDSMISTSGGAQQDRVAGGTQRLSIAMAEDMGEHIVLGAAVSEIEWSDNGVRVRAGKRQWRARHAIVAVPPPLVAGIRFAPDLPAERAQLLQRLPMGWTIKVNVVYDEPFWRTQGLSGQANSVRRALGTVFDASPPDTDPAVLVGFLEATHAQTAARLAPKQRRDVVLDDLAAYFGPKARNPVEYIEQDWAAETYTRGCYGAFATPSTLTRFGSELRRPTGPLHWAGTETATRWAGYIDGAVESGQRAAHEIFASTTR